MTTEKTEATEKPAGTPPPAPGKDKDKVEAQPSNGSGKKEEKKPEKKEEKKPVKSKAQDDDVIEVPIDAVQVEKGANPRQTFDRERLNSMAQSFKHLGIMNPLTVRVKEGHKGYFLVAGERRLKAAKIAGLKTVPVRIKQYTDGQATYARFTENAQQERLNPLEFAQSIQNMIGQTIERPATEGKSAKPEVVNAKIAAEIARVTPGAVSQYLALLTLPKEIQEAIRAGKVSFAMARTICGEKEHAAQMALFKKITSGEAKKASDVREAAEKSRAKKATKGEKKRGRPTQTDEEKPNIQRQGLEIALDRLRQVKIEPRQTKEIRESIATAYERHERAKSDDKKLYSRGVIAGLEFAAGLRENF
jgi:ParB family chromosome partitioning protein